MSVPVGCVAALVALWLSPLGTAAPVESSVAASGDGNSEQRYWAALERIERETGKTSSFTYYRQLNTAAFSRPRQVYEAAKWVHLHGWGDNSTTATILERAFIEGDGLLQTLEAGIRANNPVLPPHIGPETPVADFKRTELIGLFALARARRDTARKLISPRKPDLDFPFDRGIDVLVLGGHHQSANSPLVEYLVGAALQRKAEDFLLYVVTAGRTSPDACIDAIRRIVAMESARKPMVEGWNGDMAYLRDFLVEGVRQSRMNHGSPETEKPAATATDDSKGFDHDHYSEFDGMSSDDSTTPCIVQYMNDYIKGGGWFADLSPTKRFEIDARRKGAGEKSGEECRAWVDKIAIASLTEALRREELVTQKLRLIVTALALQNSAARGMSRDDSLAVQNALERVGVDPSWGTDLYTEKEFKVEKAGENSVRLIGSTPPWYDDSYRATDEVETFTIELPLVPPRP